MRSAAFKFKKTPRGYVVNTPASLSENGKRTRQYFATQDEARGACTELRNRFLDHGNSAPTLPPGQSDLAARAFKKLAAANHPDEAILAAVKLYNDRAKAEAASVTFTKACKSYADAKDHRTPRHIADIGRLPDRFSAISEKLVATIQPGELEEHLDTLPGPMRNLILRQTRAVLNFAVRRGWATENPANRVDLAHVPAPEVHLLTGEQLHFMMTTAAETDPELCPLIAIEAFAGVRPDVEAKKVAWEDIDLADNILTVTAAASKTRRARHIGMHPTLRAWLDWHIARDGRDKGPITPATGTPLRKRLRALRGKAGMRLLMKMATMEPDLHTSISASKDKEAVEEPSFGDLIERFEAKPNLISRLHSLREKAGIDPWPQDCLRHTFASAALATGWRDISGLCLDLGHASPAVLHKHYHRAMRRAEGEAVFAVTPP